MDDYIPRQEVINKLTFAGALPDYAQYLIESIPAAETEEIKFGHWFDVSYNDKIGVEEGRCSVCDSKAVADYELYPRCPHCGAFMLDIKEGDRVIHSVTKIKGEVVKIYTSQSRDPRVDVISADGRVYHAPLIMWRPLVIGGQDGPIK